MLKNHFLIAWRSLRQHRRSSILNILGLSMGITAGLLIFQYTWYEWSYDKGVSDSERIYRLGLTQKDEFGQIQDLATTFPGFKKLLDDQLPEAANIARLTPVFGGDISVFSPKISKREEEVFFADPEIIEIFGLKVIKGSEYNLLTNPDEALLTESGAKRYFPKQEPIGQEIEVVSEFDRKVFKIAGIVEDISTPSHLSANILLPVSNLMNDKFVGESFRANWNDPSSYTYLKLKEPGNVSEKINDLIATNVPGLSDRTSFLQPIETIHLHSAIEYEHKKNGNYDQWRFLILLGIFILLIAWFNYINLATAKSLQRSREVGIRKMVGATRKQLITQFLFESFWLNMVALVIAFTIIQFTLPNFSEWLGKPLPGLTPIWSGLMVGFVLVGAFLSGVYPAFVLSAFDPGDAIKGLMPVMGRKVNGQNQFRRILVSIQFVISICLIAGTYLIYQQLEFMQNQDLGFNPDQILVVNGPEVKAQTAFEKFEDSTNLYRIDRFKQKALTVPGVNGFSAVDGLPGGKLGYSKSTLTWEGKESRTLAKIMTDQDFIAVFEVPLIAGTFFEARHQNQENPIVVTRGVIESMSFETVEDAVGKVVKDDRGFDYTIIGITEDYHHQSLQNAKSPMIYLLYKPEEIPTFEYHSSYALKVEAANLDRTISRLKLAYREAFPANDFSSFFFDEHFNTQYQDDQRFGTLFGFFSVLAILIACLGLIGLIGFSAFKRSKEIGIRKILGAEVSDIFLLLSKEFFVLIVIAGLIAVPFIWFGAKEWLSQYAFRISLGLFLFLLPFFAVLLIALLSISFQTIKAAKEDPIEVLRE